MPRSQRGIVPPRRSPRGCGRAVRPRVRGRRRRRGAVAHAQALFQAGDVRAADEALHLGPRKYRRAGAALRARAELFPQKRGS